MVTNRFLKAFSWKAFVKIVLFLMIGILLLQCISWILMGKIAIGNISSLYTEPKGSIDIVFMGTSHMVNAVYPMELWREFGYTSLNQGQNGQTLPATYYALKEVLRLQTPKLIVLDLYYLNAETSVGNLPFTHETIDHLPFIDRLSFVLNTVPRENSMEFLFPISLYHDRWKTLKAMDLRSYTRSAQLGANISFEQSIDYESLSLFSLLNPSQIEEPSIMPKSYLEKIVALCQKKNVAILLVVLPYLPNPYASEDDQAYFNWAGAYALNHDIPYWNMLWDVDGILQFDYRSDMRDSTHANYWGARKITSALGAYIGENFSIQDHREDDAYAYWDSYVASYDVYVAQKEKKAENTTEDE